MSAVAWVIAALFKFGILCLYATTLMREIYSKRLLFNGLLQVSAVAKFWDEDYLIPMT